MNNKINHNLRLMISLIALVIGTFCFPGQVTKISVLLGFPIRFLTIYHSTFDMLVVRDILISTIKVNPISLIANLMIYHFLYQMALKLRYHIKQRKEERSNSKQEVL